MTETQGIDFNQLKQMEEMKKQVLGKMLDKAAFERLARVRIANPQLAGHVELYLMQLFQTGKLNEPVSESKLIEVLRILSEKRDISIRRK